MKTMGEKIKELRIKKRLTQQELADKIGVSYTTISLYESGSRKPSFKALNKLAKVFEVNEAYFFEEENNSTDNLNQKIKIASRNMESLSEENFELVNSLIKQMLDNNKNGK